MSLTEAALALSDGYHNTWGSMVFEIAAPAKKLAVNLNLTAGQPVAGATSQVFASGLKPGAAWTVTVRSTPIVVGSGKVAANGQHAG